MSYLFQICLHFLAKYVLQDLNYNIIALLNCNWFSLLKILLIDAIKDNFINSCKLMTYGIAKGALKVCLASSSVLFLKKCLQFLRARILPHGGNFKLQSFINYSFLGDTKHSHRDNNFSFTPLYTFFFLIPLLLSFQQVHSAPQISIVWGTTTNSAASDILKGFDGLALSAGVQGNGDGDLVELGYFSEASADNPFSGDWTPLTKQTRVGDSSSGYGFNNGMFIFTTTFQKDSDRIIVFPTEPKEYEEDLGFTITLSTPPSSTPICIRFYDSTQKAGAKYNTVTGDNWLWPSFPSGSSIPTNLYLKIASGAAPAGSSWKYGSTFEDPDNSFKASISPQYEINLAISDGSGTGRVGFGSDIDQNITSLVRFFGESVTINALPNLPHSEFMGWVGTGITDPYNKTTTLTVNGDQKEIYAEFFAIPYSLDIEVIGEGEVLANGQNTPLSFSYDDNVTVSAFPNSGFSFLRWEMNGTEISSNSETSINIQGNTELVAIFSGNQYQVNIDETVGGTYEILDNTGSTASNPYSHGITYTLRAFPEQHYGFSSWYGTASGLSMLGNQGFAQTTFIPTADVNFTAIFSELSYKLNIESTQGYSFLSTSGSFPALSIVPVEVEVAEGFVFDYWLDPMGILADPYSLQTEANISRIYPYMEASISAVLRVNEYNATDINITASPGGSISWETDEFGGFTHFKSYELNASSILGYHFDKWTGDVELLEFGAFEPTNKILVNGPLSLQANFQLTEYEILVSSIGNGFSTSPDTFTIEDSPKIEAFSFPGWKFSRWTGDVDFLLDPLSEETIIQPTISSNTQNLSFIANFIPLAYEFNLHSLGNGTVDLFLSDGTSFDSVESKQLSIDSETQIFLEAYPAEGWRFTSWSGLPSSSELLNPEAVIDPNSSFSYFYPPNDLNISAQFEFINYDINFESSVGGSIEIYDSEVSTPETFGHKLEYTIRAVPKANYGFNSWISSEGGLAMLGNKDSAQTSLIPTQDANYTALFDELSYQLNIESDSGYSSLTPSDSFPALSIVPVEVNTATGYVFDYWSDPMGILTNSGSSQTEANMSLVYPAQEATITANLSLAEYDETDINITSEDGGNISFETDGAGRFTHFNSYEINATAILGYEFDQWIGDTAQLEFAPNFPNNKLLIEGPITLQATFKIIEYTINLSSLEGGSVIGPETLTIFGNTAITTTALPGWRFSHWSGDTDYLSDVSTDPTFIAIENNSVPNELSFVANFTPITYDLNLHTSGEGVIDISLSNGEAFYAVESKYLNVDSQTQLSLYASPPEGWRFTSWSGLPETSELFNPQASLEKYEPSISFYPSKNLNIGATFELLEYNSSEVVIGLGGGQVVLDREEDGKFIHFSSYDLVATPNYGYSFSEWLINPSLQHLLLNGIDAAENSLKIEGPVEINASFSINYYNLNVTNTSGGQTISPDSYTVNDTPLIKAESDPGWKFSHWSGDTNYLSDSNDQITTIDHSTYELKDLSFIAHFIREEYDINLESDGSGIFEIYKNSNLHSSDKHADVVRVDSGTRIAVSANASNGWKFSQWFGLPPSHSLRDSSPSLNSTNPDINFIPSADTNISAKYIRQSFTLSTPIPQFGGTPSGEGEYLFQSEVDINVTLENHFSFKEWSGDTSNLKYHPSISENIVIIPDSNISLTPIFVPNLYSVQTFADENGSIETRAVFYDNISENLADYNASSELTVIASPNNAEEHMLGFIYWENSKGESGFSYSPSVTIPFLESNYSFEAYFVPRRVVSYELVVSPPFGGTAGEDPSSSNTIHQNLVSAPNEGYSFLGWSTDSLIPLQPHWTLPNVDAELIATDRVEAHFALQTKFLNLQYNPDHGSVDGFSEEISHGEYLSLKAMPNDNYAFKNWELLKEVNFKVSKDLSSINQPFTRLFINKQESPELNLIRGFTYLFDCNLSVNEEFFISSSPNGEDTDSYYLAGITGHLTSNGTLTFQVPVDAPSTLYYHDTGNNYSGNKIHITSLPESSIIEDINNPILKQRVVHHFGLQANFERTKHNFTISASGQGEVNHVNQDVYFWGDEIEIIAEPSDHWYFSHWEENPGIEDPNSSITTQIILGDTNVRAVFNKIQYQVNADVIPTEYGSVNNPQQTFTFGESVTMTALPKLGMQFDEWVIIENLSIEDPADKFNPTTTFQVLGNAKVEAKFSKIPLNIDIHFMTLDQDDNVIEEEVGGTVSFPTSIFYGDSLELNPNIYPGYAMLYWIDTNTGIIISSEKNLNLTPTGNQNLKIVLRKLHYNLEINTSGDGSIDNLLNPPFYWGDQITISATPLAHWDFFRWSGDGSEYIDDQFSANTKITIKGDSSIVAEFKPTDYSLTLSSTPEGFGGVSNLEQTYNFGDIVEIEATAKEGKYFDFWTIDSNDTPEQNQTATDNPLQFEVLGDTSITAHFESKTYTVTKKMVVVDQSGSPVHGVYAGKILGAEEFKDEEFAEFELLINDGYLFKYWSIDGVNEIESTEQVFRHQMLSDINLTAVVTSTAYEVKINIYPANGGYASLNVLDDNVTENFVISNLSYGQNIDINASAAEGYSFIEWSVVGTNLQTKTLPNQSFSIANDLIIDARFARSGLIDLNITSRPQEAAAYTFGSGSFEYNPDHPILAMAKKGYNFLYWEHNNSIAHGIVKEANSSSTSLILDEDRQLTAVFEVDENQTLPTDDSNKLFLLSVSSSDINMGTTSGTGFFRGSRNIKAFPNDGYSFSHWEGTEAISSIYDKDAQVSVFQKLTIVAHFQSIGYFTDSEALDNGWWGNPWFGYFWKVGEEDWLFHEKLGWTFLKKQGDNSIWIWIQKMNGWFWTTKEHYPYLHGDQSQSWYWLNLEQSDFTRLVIYDYINLEWLSL